MKLNKFIFSVMLVGCGAIVTTSCNDYLEEKPKSFIGPDNVGDSQDAVDTWVTGVYSNWLYDMFCWSEFPRVLELDADYISGPDWLFGHLGAGDFQGESALEKMWKGPYNLINDANMAIRYIGAMSSVDEAYKNNALGEMYFQKAFAYFLLVRAYGPVPYFDTDVAAGNTYYEPRRPVSEIYDHIIDMLTKASSLMYHIDNANYKKGHVCAGSAAGLLAKVYCTMASAAMPEGTKIIVKTGVPYETVNGKQHYRLPSAETFSKDTVAGYTKLDPQALYTKAAEWAKKVIDGDFGPYVLTDYDKLWTAAHRNDAEFMFGVQSTNGDTKYCTHIHTFYSGYTESAASEFLTSGGWVGCTNNWYSLFDDNDYRVTKGVRHTWRYYYQESYNGCFYYPQSWSVKMTGFDVDGNYVREPDAEYKATGLMYQYNQSSECLAFTTKYDDVTNKATDYADSQWPFLRYADVILCYAEAENELGNASTAIKYLNVVRARSNANLMTTNPGQTDLRSSIIEERAKEFACEADRRWDLIRWGIYLDVMNTIGHDDGNISKVRTARNLLYPIPTAEMNVNKAITENNPGWN
jgi:hypothetical protein